MHKQIAMQRNHLATDFLSNLSKAD